MSVVTVQVGQCGNQVGNEFFTRVMDDVLTGGGHLGQCTQSQNDSYCEEAYNRFFTEDEQLSKSCHETTWTAKSVMVDMESKVIEQIAKEAKQSGRWSYPDNQLFCQKRGSGNNWACGFCLNGPKESEAILNMVQTEVEKCDRLDGFLTLLSLAGIATPFYGKSGSNDNLSYLGSFIITVTNCLSSMLKFTVISSRFEF